MLVPRGRMQDGVLHQIGQHLHQQGAVAANGGRGRDNQVQVMAGAFGHGLEHFAHLLQQRRQFQGGEGGAPRPAFDLGDAQQSGETAPGSRRSWPVRHPGRFARRRPRRRAPVPAAGAVATPACAGRGRCRWSPGADFPSARRCGSSISLMVAASRSSSSWVPRTAMRRAQVAVHDGAAGFRHGFALVQEGAADQHAAQPRQHQRGREQATPGCAGCAKARHASPPARCRKKHTGPARSIGPRPICRHGRRPRAAARCRFASPWRAGFRPAAGHSSATAGNRRRPARPSTAPPPRAPRRFPGWHSRAQSRRCRCGRIAGSGLAAHRARSPAPPRPSPAPRTAKIAA